MADVVLSTREITFNFRAFTYEEWLGIFEEDVTKDYTDELIARVGGLTLHEFRALDFVDYNEYCDAFWKRARNPLNKGNKDTVADPNSPSASTSA